MELKNVFRASAVATAIVLAGCGGDINITEGNIDNSQTINNPPTQTPTPTPTPSEPLPGEFSSSLTQAVTQALGRSVTVQVLSGTITEDTTLTTDAFYALSGSVFVGGDNENSAVLTVEPGVVIFGQSGSDAMVVSRGSRLEAAGTASQPIIMTSLQDVVGEPISPGQWGGLVLLGNAPSNKCPTDGTPCAREVEGVADAFYGGTDTEDNSGTLQYVVVKNSGFEVEPGNELNGITFGGVGSGTTVDHIQVHNSSDDGVEFFGGNVDVKYLVLTNNQDDSIDWDHGFQGRMQHIYVQHNPNASDANRIIEADNDGSNLDASPKSNPTLVNMTAIGNNFAADEDPSEGIYLREGTGGQFYNIVVTGPSEMGECFEVEGNAVSQANLGDGTILMENSAFACTNEENFKNGDTDVDLEAWFLGQTGNFVSDAPMIMSDGQPMAGSPLLGVGQDTSNTVDGFFDATNYVGAFDGSSDWREGWAFGYGGGEVTAQAEQVGCPTGTSSILSVDGSTTTCEIPAGTITADTTLTAGNIYALSGVTFVGGDNENSATLTIEPGVTIYGRSASDALVVSRGSQIMAEGTAAAPITFTSTQDVTGEATGPGQWGGVVLLGNAQSNKCPTDGTPCAREVEGVSGAFYGGTNDEDNSGVLRYVVVKHGGFEVEPGNELNGITFGGVGSGTTVEYIQVHQNSDDGIEFFGGTVNLKYVVLTANQDDSVDWDHGYRGKMQYVLVQHATDDSDANRLIEADNDGSNLAAEPKSNPTIANFTGIGNNFNPEDDPSEGIYLREGTGAQLYNLIVTGPAMMGECFEVEGNAVSQANLGDGTISMTNAVFACENSENFKNADGDVDLEAWFLGQNGNSIAANRAAVLNGIFTTTDAAARDFTGDTFFDNVDFIGAVEEGNDWTAGWTVGL